MASTADDQTVAAGLAEPPVAEPAPRQITREEAEMIERVVWAEARGEGPEGRDAVRSVILNRLDSDRFPDTVEGVLTQRNQFEPVGRYGSIADIPAPPEDLDQQYFELFDLLDRGEDITQGSTFFLNKAIAQERGTDFSGDNPIVIGNHTFYSSYNGQEPVQVSENSHRVVLADNVAQSIENSGATAPQEDAAAPQRSRPLPLAEPFEQLAESAVAEAPTLDVPETPPASADDQMYSLMRNQDPPIRRLSTQTRLGADARYDPNKGRVVSPVLQRVREALGFNRGGLALGESEKGIRTRAGMDMAGKAFRLDYDKADLNQDGRLSEYEKVRGEAIQKAIQDEDEMMKAYHGGMPCGMMEAEGLPGEITGYDPVSGNAIPVGSTEENVRDDIPAMISEGEYVLPADVVKWHGLKHIMDLQMEAKMGLMSMNAMGLIHHVEEIVEHEEMDDDVVVCPECEGEGCDHCDGTGYHSEDEGEYETPEGNAVEVAEVVTEEEYPLEEIEEEDVSEDEYPTEENMSYAMKATPKVVFIK